MTAILQSASGGGVRPALATAAARIVRDVVRQSALSACEVSGPSTVTRALTASWRGGGGVGAWSGTGKRSICIDADPSSGLALAPVSHWDVHGGWERGELGLPLRSMAGPSTTAWRTRSAGAVLHLRWLVDPARPWAGVSPLQRAADTGSLAGWLDKRLAEESSGPVGSFLPVAKYDADPDLDADDADDPLALLRRDIGGARGQTLIVETAMAAADSPASAPRKDFQVARFGANPPRHLVELREQVARDVGGACGVPRALLDSSASGQASREAWRQFISASIDGLARRIEAQLLDQLGVDVKIDTSPLGGRDLLARASAFRRFTEAGMTVADARDAAGI